jgi:hypothetical protein
MRYAEDRYGKLHVSNGVDHTVVTDPDTPCRLTAQWLAPLWAWIVGEASNGRHLPPVGLAVLSMQLLQVTLGTRAHLYPVHQRLVTAQEVDSLPPALTLAKF